MGGSWSVPQIIHFDGIFHVKPSILGTPLYGNPDMIAHICHHTSVLRLAIFLTWPPAASWKHPRERPQSIRGASGVSKTTEPPSKASAMARQPGWWLGHPSEKY